MKKLLLPSIIAMLAVPAFATTPTTLPNNALCNETNLGTESGSADIEVVWTPNTINTQWYTGYGENTAAANATTCEYGGTINLPATNPSRAGYAFAGWKLRAQCLIPSTDVNNSPIEESTGCLDINGDGPCAGKTGW
ncbi:MAG: InlB B-repeat-containing protein, partial [Alphaproteobacteria bacterium]|nr:InlB B-repeat-containing protein [Alphaproteobacteria bacterium]